MTLIQPFRRALPFGLALGAAACDIANFAADPRPIFEQTWNLPATGTEISVASLLPTGVTIFSTPGSTPPASSAFDVTVSDVVFQKRVGDDCTPCQAQNGTTAIKPAFRINAGSSSPLPQDMISGAVLGGLVNVNVTNTMSFDPLRVRSSGTPQGYMVLVVRSGSVVLGRDSVNGADIPFPPGTTLVRPITLTSGTVTANVAVDLVLDSPPSENPVLINANGTVNTRAVIADLFTGTVLMNVVNKNMTSTSADTLPLDDLDESITDHVVGGTLAMSITNPFPVGGNIDVRFVAPALLVTKQVSMPTGTNQSRSVVLDSADMQSLLGNRVALSIGGPVSSTTPVLVSPKQYVAISNRLILIIRTGS